MSSNTSLAANGEITGGDLATSDDACQYLTFYMAGEEYGVDILHVQEIRGWEDCTEIPNSPGFVRGVLNLRGTIVPVMDLRARFSLPDKDYDDTTVVIVLKVNLENKDKIMGIAVDAVSDVYTFPNDEIKAAPDFGATINADFILGLVNINDTMLNILNIDKTLDLNISAEATALTTTA